MKIKPWIWKSLSVFIALGLWQIMALTFGIDYLLASPLQTLVKLYESVCESGFWFTVFQSFWRITAGFIIAFVLGIILAALAAKYKLVESFLWPYMITVKTVPVASFIVLALILLSSDNLSMLTAAIIALPIIYNNVLTGIKGVDTKMLDMAKVFNLSESKVIKYIRLPAVKPYIISSSNTAIGMAWKAGIAAEIIGIPKNSIGFEMYLSKVNIDSADLFAWTAVVVFVSVMFEKLFVALLKFAFKSLERH